MCEEYPRWNGRFLFRGIDVDKISQVDAVCILVAYIDKYGDEKLQKEINMLISDEIYPDIPKEVETYYIPTWLYDEYFEWWLERWLEQNPNAGKLNESETEELKDILTQLGAVF